MLGRTALLCDHSNLTSINRNCRIIGISFVAAFANAVSFSLPVNLHIQAGFPFLLTLKAPITTAADDIRKYFFIDF